MSQGLGATRIIACLVTAGHGRFKIRLIADDQIILGGVMFGVIINILRVNLNALRLRRFLHIITCLLSGGFVQFHCIDHHLSSRTLRQHQHNQSATATDVQHPLRLCQRCPSTKQHAISTHFHRTAIVSNKELLKSKTAAAQDKICFRLIAHNNHLDTKLM